MPLVLGPNPNPPPHCCWVCIWLICKWNVYWIVKQLSWLKVISWMEDTIVWKFLVSGLFFGKRASHPNLNNLLFGRRSYGLQSKLMHEDVRRVCRTVVPVCSKYVLEEEEAGENWTGRSILNTHTWHMWWYHVLQKTIFGFYNCVSSGHVLRYHLLVHQLISHNMTWTNAVLEQNFFICKHDITSCAKCRSIRTIAWENWTGWQTVWGKYKSPFHGNWQVS